MEVEAASERCRSIMERIKSLSISKVTDSCKRTLLRLANSELNFLSHLSLSNFKPSSLSPSSNVGYIEAVVHILELPFITGVSRVCKQLSVSPEIQNKNKKDSKYTGVYVDVVCSLNKNPVWFIVSNRNPKYILWNGSRGSNGLKARVEQVLAAAQSSTIMKPSSIILFFSSGLENFVRLKLIEEFGFSHCEMDFSHFDFILLEEPDNEWVNVLPRSYQKACILSINVNPVLDTSPITGYCVRDSKFCAGELESVEKRKDANLHNSFHSLITEMGYWFSHVKDVEYVRAEGFSMEYDLVNFDTTALVAIVSGISNGGAEKLLAMSDSDLRDRFKNNVEFVMSQDLLSCYLERKINAQDDVDSNMEICFNKEARVMAEINSPIHVELHGLLAQKKGIVCETVLSEFLELVSMCGGPNEKLRADDILKHVMVINDCPSTRMMSLPTTRKLAWKNKVVFGTGDYCGAPTLTANMGFVRAVSQTVKSCIRILGRAKPRSPGHRNPSVKFSSTNN